MNIKKRKPADCWLLQEMPKKVLTKKCAEYSPGCGANWAEITARNSLGWLFGAESNSDRRFTMS